MGACKAVGGIFHSLSCHPERGRMPESKDPDKLFGTMQYQGILALKSKPSTTFRLYYTYQSTTWRKRWPLGQPISASMSQALASASNPCHQQTLGSRHVFSGEKSL